MNWACDKRIRFQRSRRLVRKNLYQYFERPRQLVDLTNSSQVTAFQRHHSLSYFFCVFGPPREPIECLVSFGTSREPKNTSCDELITISIYKAANTSFLHNAAQEHDGLLLYFTFFFVKPFPASYSSVQSSNDVFQSSLSVMCRRSSSVSKLASEATQKIFLTSFVPFRFKICNTIYTKDKKLQYGLFCAQLYFHASSPLHSGYFFDLCADMPTILYVRILGAVSAFSLRSRTVQLFHAPNVVAGSGFLLLPSVARMGKVHARAVLTSIQLGMLGIRHRLRCELDSPGLLALATLRDLLQKQ